MEAVPSVAMQGVPQGSPSSTGQSGELPLHRSGRSQLEVAARHATPAAFRLQVLASQQASRAEQRLLFNRLQVLQSQQGSADLPQSHS